MQAGINVAETTVTARGWHGDICMTVPYDSGIAHWPAQLARVDNDCAVIGDGLRIPPKGLPFYDPPRSA